MLCVLANFHLRLKAWWIFLFQGRTDKFPSIDCSWWRVLRHLCSFNLATHFWFVLTTAIHVLTGMLFLLGMQQSVALEQVFLHHYKLFFGNYLGYLVCRWSFNTVWIEKTCRFFNAFIGLVLYGEPRITWRLYCRVASFHIQFERCSGLRHSRNVAVAS